MPEFSKRARRSKDPRFVVSDTGTSLRVGKQASNKEIGVYQNKNIFAYQASNGLSLQNDLADPGNGVIEDANGAIRMRTSADADDQCVLKTVKTGECPPGKTSEWSSSVKLVTRPTGDGYIRIGCFDSTSGYYFEITEDEVYVVARRNGVDIKVPQAEWNVDKLNGTGAQELNEDNPSGQVLDLTIPIQFGLRYSYAGTGTANFFLDVDSDPTEAEDIVRYDVHRYKTNDFPATEAPNKQLLIEMGPGTSGTQVELLVGGRRFDIFGEASTEKRVVGELVERIEINPNEFLPLVAIKKKDQFPVSSGRPNTINTYIKEFTIITNEDIIVYFAVAGATDDGTYVDAQNYDLEPQSIEFNKDCTTYQLGQPVLGPILIPGGTSYTFNAKDEDIQINLIGNGEPNALVARSLGLQNSSAIVTASITLVQEF